MQIFAAAEYCAFDSKNDHLLHANISPFESWPEIQWDTEHGTKLTHITSIKLTCNSNNIDTRTLPQTVCEEDYQEPV